MKESQERRTASSRSKDMGDVPWRVKASWFGLVCPSIHRTIMHPVLFGPNKRKPRVGPALDTAQMEVVTSVLPFIVSKRRRLKYRCVSRGPRFLAASRFLRAYRTS